MVVLIVGAGLSGATIAEHYARHNIKSIVIEFLSEGDLERFFAQMLREDKINQILGDTKDKK